MKPEVNRERSKRARALFKLDGRGSRPTRRVLLRQIEQLTAVNTMARCATSSLSMDEVVRAAQAQILSALTCDATVFYRVQDESLFLHGVQPKKKELRKVGTRVSRSGQCLCGLSASQGRPVYSLNIHTDDRCTLNECKHAGMHSFAALPLAGKNTMLGVVGIGSYSEQDFSQQAPFLEALTSYVSLGLQNAGVHEEVRTRAAQLKRLVIEHEQAAREKEQLEIQLLYAQKMEALGTLAGGIAHNFNNLLMGIQANISLMLFDTNPAHPNYEKLLNIETVVERGAQLTNQLLGYAREGRYEIRHLNLNQVVRDMAATFSATRKEIDIHLDLAEDLWEIRADKGQMEQILLNLLVNAADAMPGGGHISLETMYVTHEDLTGKPYKPRPGTYAVLVVKDSGGGMDTKTLKQVFDPFFTTKGMSRSVGLGLPSVYGIIKAHGGYIDVDSKRGYGTTFRIYLPCAERE